MREVFILNCGCHVLIKRYQNLTGGDWIEDNNLIKVCDEHNKGG